MFNIAPWLPSLELPHRGECPLPVKSAGTLRREWRPSVKYHVFSEIGDLLSYCKNVALFALVHVFRAARPPALLQFPLFISYLTGTVVLSREINRSRREADHLHLRQRWEWVELYLCSPCVTSRRRQGQLYPYRDTFRYLPKPSCCGPSEKSVCLNFNSDYVFFGRTFPINIGNLNIKYTASRTGRQ